MNPAITSTLEITSVQIAAFGLVITAIGALWALFRTVTNQSDNLRRELMAEVEKTEAVQSKSLHDKNNSIQLLIAKLDVDLERLKREAVKREDMQQIENRLTQSLAKVEGKVDTMLDKLAAFGALERQVQQMENRLSEALRRLEPRNNRGGGNNSSGGGGE